MNANATRAELIELATEYLRHGGLFNPGLMDHELVSQLIYLMREELKRST